MSIKQIAEKAGVSPATVSRVLNTPNYKCSSPELRDKIWKIAMDLNYTPNESARNLKKGQVNAWEKTHYIQVIVTRTNQGGTDPFYTELLHVIESEIHRNFCILSSVLYMPVFSDSCDNRIMNWDNVIGKMKEEAGETCDGLIIIGKCNKDALLRLRAAYPNLVSVNRNSTNYEIDEILCDGYKIAVTAVGHLISLGHRKIGYVGNCHEEARYQGYIHTLSKNNIRIEPDYVIETEQTEREGYECMQRWLQSDRCPTGIYCANDITAVGMLKCLQKNKKRYFVPSVISSDDIECAQDTKPMLTTVNLPKEDMGRFALYLLLDRIKGGHKGVIRIELEGKLMIRNSCVPVGESYWSDYSI